jgi:paraquat-inducible protein B
MYRQKDLNSQNKDITVGTKIRTTTTIPDTLGSATSVVEKIAKSKNTISFIQSLLHRKGHFKNKPKNLLLYPFVFPFNGTKKDLRCIRSPKKGNGQIVHQTRPNRGVRIAVNINNQTAHINKTPKFRPETLVPSKEVRITM